MKSDRTTRMTPRIARKLAELGIVLPPETTIHEANRVLSQAVQPKKPIDNPVLEKVRGVDISWKRLDPPPVSVDEAIANIQRILQESVDTGAGQIIGGDDGRN